MKKLSVFLVMVALIGGSCNRDDIYLGDISVRVIGTLPPDPKVGLYDVSILARDGNYYLERDALRTESISRSNAEFNDVNVGNYVVALVGTNSRFQAVQVKGGKRSDVTFN